MFKLFVLPAVAALIASSLYGGEPCGKPPAAPTRPAVPPLSRAEVLEQLQGTWTVVEWKDGEFGSALEPETLKEYTITFHGNRATTRLYKNKQDRKVTIDVSRTPMRMDSKGSENKAIFHIDGDTLTICSGRERPTGFALTPGVDDPEIIVLKKNKLP